MIDGRITSGTIRGLALLLTVALAACSAPQAPAPPPVIKPAPAAATAEPRPTGPGGYVVVRPGDSLSIIAQRKGVTLEDLIETNGLSAPYVIHPGQKLKLPGLRYHVVQRGDTLYGVARTHTVGLGDLIQLNDLMPPYRVMVGQKLRLPPPGEDPVMRATAIPVPSPRSVAQITARPVAVGSGRTSGKTVTKPPVRLSKPPPRTSSRFLWPVRGRLISRFGSGGKGLYNDGINIAAPKGTKVRAAENGVVAYAGNELAGFGNLLLIKHADGWMSAYAHNEKLLVRTGQRIKRGQIVAQVGETGRVASPQLHFELRRGEESVDPTKYLAS